MGKSTDRMAAQDARELREAVHLTQEEWADALGVSPSWVRGIEYGQRPITSEKAQRMATVHASIMSAALHYSVKEQGWRPDTTYAMAVLAVGRWHDDFRARRISKEALRLGLKDVANLCARAFVHDIERTLQKRKKGLAALPGVFRNDATEAHGLLSYIGLCCRSADWLRRVAEGGTAENTLDLSLHDAWKQFATPTLAPPITIDRERWKWPGEKGSPRGAARKKGRHR